MELRAGLGRYRPTPVRAVLWSALVAVLVYLGALGNGFAFDDEPIVERNPVVTEGQWDEAATGPYWRIEQGTGTLYRPVTLLAFTAQWELFGGAPLGFHLVNLLLHALVSALLAGLVLRLARGRTEGSAVRDRAPTAALLTGGLFALHPVHVEAVANVVGQSELWAALGVLAAVHLYLWSPTGAVLRTLRLLGIGTAYAVGLGAKEIAVTLPLLLVLLDTLGRGPVAVTARIRREAPVHLLLGIVLVAYLSLRWLALGSLVGEQATTVFFDAADGSRVWTALAVVPTLFRLLVFPFDLAADYDPAVLTPAGPFELRALLGAVLVLGLAVGALAASRRAPLLTFGAFWFLIAWSPVSNLAVATGVLLAERTLYLPSIGAAVMLGVLGTLLVDRSGRRAALVVVGVVGIAFSARVITRVPTWYSTFTVLENLAVEHPESWRSDRTRAAGLLRVGEREEAFRFFERALEKMPYRYDLLLEYAVALRDVRELDEARDLLERAVETRPHRLEGWRLLAELHLLAGRTREAHRVATVGLQRAGQDAELWRLVSEAYVGGGFLPAAVRARRMALLLDPGDRRNAERLQELLGVMGQENDSLPVGANPDPEGG